MEWKNETFTPSHSSGPTQLVKIMMCVEMKAFDLWAYLLLNLFHPPWSSRKRWNASTLLLSSLDWIDAFPVLSSQILGVFLVVENRCGDRYSIISCRKMGAQSLRPHHSILVFIQWPLSICWLQLFAYFAVVVVQSLSHVWVFASSWTAAHQASLSFTITWSLLKPMSIESVMPTNHLILCRALLLLPSIFPSIRVFSNESAPSIWWPKDWSFSFSTSPSNEYSGLTAFRIYWFDLLAVQGTLKSLL